MADILFRPTLHTESLPEARYYSWGVYPSLTLTGLISAWRRGKASSAILSKPLTYCVTVLCLGQCKSRHCKVCGIMKRTCYLQTNWISNILNWDVRYLCCRWRRFHVLLFWASSYCPPPPPPPHTHTHTHTRLIGEPPAYYLNWSRRSLTKIVPWSKQR